MMNGTEDEEDQDYFNFHFLVPISMGVIPCGEVRYQLFYVKTAILLSSY